MKLTRPLALAGFCLCGALAARAYTPETTPRPGEERFNHFQYKASHNSYLRAVPLNTLVDDYNTWEVELDIYWFNDKQDETSLRVAHALPTVGSRTMANYLRELMQSSTWTQRFTFIDLGMKSTPIYKWPAQATYRATIKAQLNSILGADNIYRFAEFRDTDHYKWPSMQELIRRGKHFAIILDEIDRAPSDDFFEFGFSPAMPGTGPWPNPQDVNKIVYNTSDETVAPSGLGDTYLARAWQDEVTFCPAFWETALDNGFSFVALNCVTDDDAMQEPRFHSPQPFYVDSGGASSKQWGTRGFPLRGSGGLSIALSHASPMVDVSVQAGAYQLPSGTTINRPLKIVARDGAVTIQ